MTPPGLLKRNFAGDIGLLLALVFAVCGGLGGGSNFIRLWRRIYPHPPTTRAALDERPLYLSVHS